MQILIDRAYIDLHDGVNICLVNLISELYTRRLLIGFSDVASTDKLLNEHRLQTTQVCQEINTTNPTLPLYYVCLFLAQDLRTCLNMVCYVSSMGRSNVQWSTLLGNAAKATMFRLNFLSTRFQELEDKYNATSASR